MVQGLKFLSKKGFHPQNKANQKRVWEAEQEGKQRLEEIHAREEQLRRERDEEELAQARGDAPRVSFVYAPPPGMEVSRPIKSSKEESSSNHGNSNVHVHPDLSRRPGDDDAAAAFRRMFACPIGGNSSTTQHNESPHTVKRAFGSTVLQGSSVEHEEQRDRKSGSDSLSALEKAVGRKGERSNEALTLEEQILRFPVLANAPRVNTATDVGFRFNPLGTQIRNVKCLACGVWGHSRGDRECSKSGWDPFRTTAPTPKPQQDVEDRRGQKRRVDDHQSESTSSEERKSSRKRRNDFDGGESRKKSHRRRKSRKEKRKKSKKKEHRY